ncbi:MAG: glycosyltransferase [Candidatus Roizmanbacteria bacterium]
MTNKIEITLVIPCYNEAANIQKGVLDKIGNFTNKDPRFREVIIVDDGSTDSSRDLIVAYLKEYPQMQLIKNNHTGKAIAVITGIRKATSSYVMFSDIDLATPLEETDKLLEEIKNGYDVVIGSRNTHREGAPILRKIQSVGFIVIRDILIGLKGIRDTQCGFKIFKQEAGIKIIDNLQVFTKKTHVNGSSVSAGFDLEFLFLAKKLGYKIKEVPVTWRHVENKSVAFIKDSIETVKDILRIKYYDLRGKYDIKSERKS